MSRDWKRVDSRLVRQGTLLISVKFLEDWDKHLKKMNAGKIGRPFEYPKALIEYSGSLHCFMCLGYRQVKGVLEGIQKQEPLMHSPSYCNISRRFNKLAVKIQPRKQKKGADLWLAIDASGVSVSNRVNG